MSEKCLSKNLQDIELVFTNSALESRLYINSLSLEDKFLSLLLLLALKVRQDLPTDLQKQISELIILITSSINEVELLDTLSLLGKELRQKFPALTKTKVKVDQYETCIYCLPCILDDIPSIYCDRSYQPCDTIRRLKLLMNI